MTRRTRSATLRCTVAPCTVLCDDVSGPDAGAARSTRCGALRSRNRSEVGTGGARRARGGPGCSGADCSLSGCAGQARTYTDPFSYCGAVGTIDAPTRATREPAVPPAIAQGLRRAFNGPRRCAARALHARDLVALRRRQGVRVQCGRESSLRREGRHEPHAERPDRGVLRRRTRRSRGPDGRDGPRDGLRMAMRGRRARHRAARSRSRTRRGYLKNIWYEIPAAALAGRAEKSAGEAARKVAACQRRRPKARPARRDVALRSSRLPRAPYLRTMGLYPPPARRILRLDRAL